jgi:hypothetical protein
MTPADQDGAQGRLVSAPALPRLTAFALDAVTYLIILALLLPLGLLLIRHGVMMSSAAVKCDWPGIGDCAGHRLGYLVRGPAARSHSGETAVAAWRSRGDHGSFWSQRREAWLAT